jgi:hypothetical protein
MTSDGPKQLAAAICSAVAPVQTASEPTVSPGAATASVQPEGGKQNGGMVGDPTTSMGVGVAVARSWTTGAGGEVA